MVYSAEAQVLATEAQDQKVDKEQPGFFAMPGINNCFNISGFAVQMMVAHPFQF